MYEGNEGCSSTNGGEATSRKSGKMKKQRAIDAGVEKGQRAA